jgi:hypothetical protein
VQSAEREVTDSLERMFLELYCVEFSLLDIFFLTEMPASAFLPIAYSNYHTLMVAHTNGPHILSLSPSLPLSSEFASSRVSSTYPLIDKDLAIRAGDPICDYYEAQVSPSFSFSFSLSLFPSLLSLSLILSPSFFLFSSLSFSFLLSFSRYSIQFEWADI